MRNEIKSYRKMEHWMRRIGMLCNLLIIMAIFYIMGVIGSLDCNTIPLKVGIIRIMAALIISTLALSLRQLAQYIRRKAAKRRLHISAAFE